MGVNQAQTDISNNPKLSINEQLTNLIQEEIKPKIRSKKGTKNLKISHNKKLDKILFQNFNKQLYDSSDEEEDEIESEVGLNDISNLVDLIYTKNINTQLKYRANKSLYQTVFDIRNMIDFKEDLNNNEYNIKSCKIMNDIINPEILINQNNKDNRSSNKSNNSNNNSNNEEDQNLENYYIEKDFFRNWDFEDGNEDNFNKDNNITNEDFEIENNEENSEENNEDNNEENNKENNINDNNEENNKENNKNDNNETIKEKETKSNFSISKINQSEISDGEKWGKYDRDNEKNDEIKIGNETKILINNLSNSEDNDDIPKVIQLDEEEDPFEVEEDINEKTNKTDKLQFQNNKNNAYKKKFIRERSNVLVKKSVSKDKYIKYNNKKKNNNNEMFFKMKKLKNNEMTSLEKNENIKDHKDNIGNYKDKIDNNNITQRKSNISNNNIYKKNNIVNNKTYKKHNIDNNNNNIYINNTLENNNIENNKNLDNYSIDMYYGNSLRKTRSPIISRIRNRRVDNREILKNKKTIFEDTEKKQINLNDNENIYRKKYINKTPEIEIKSRTEIKNNIKNIKTTIKPQDYKHFKLNYDINDINKTIKRVEEQIKSIEKYEKKNKNIQNNSIKDIYNYNINNSKKINNIKVINNYDDEKINPLSYKKKNKKNNNIYKTKTFDGNIVKNYKDIMPEIYKAKKENEIEIINGPKYIFRAKTPVIKLNKKKVKKKGKTKTKKNNIVTINNKYKSGMSNFVNEGNKNYKYQIGNLRTGFHEKKPWK